MTIVRAAFVKI